ncbi:Actin binding family protein putative isoform 1 [Tripterygium wilfordii]|uniref:Actin binding family protein putative isoform 1 n=1 Tax=Tripterygium wilfordii TaxID=458696 RepID=A0A7J7D5P2_TRIWF|nr:protein CHUP1, chloroplastic [Tripterygium wilfordii]XP_038714117.1 protein CHUP1, chloroplastic [Tripterygium wilfordii]XP_038714118.1 protein CHUP1, chloroplastic [Tripterygium wilfordii]KAF5741642.1 Actin binding family protein putative isoform 1 [Tripterygium wilfordii]
MATREKKDINPLLVKFGIAFALSFAGFLYSRFITKKVKPSLPPPSPRTSDPRREVNSVGRAHCRDDHHNLNKMPNSFSDVPVSAEIHEETYMPRIAVESSTVGISPNSGHSVDKDGFLLPEFDDLVKEYDFSATTASFSPRKDVDTPRSYVQTPRAFRTAEKDDYEQEIRQLQSMVRMLQERERSLEVQLLEYYGLREQETAMMELKNRVHISNMESKLFTLKVESLQADNRRLQAQVADHAKVVSELDAARVKIKMLKKKLRSEAEQNKEQILALKKRVDRLPDQDLKAAASDQDIQLKLQRLKGLETDAEQLRKSNLKLQQENSDLAHRLESTQILANSVLEDPETEELRKAIIHFGQENEERTREIEQLQADRCSDVEELVYLKWINACLRYELRNYQPPSGKTAARDLSKTLSPKSEEKAKQLILEYAKTEGAREKGIDLLDFDSDQWSSSQASYLTDSGEHDDSSVDHSSDIKTTSSIKHKYISKLRRLLLGKDEHHHHRRTLSADKVVYHEDNVSRLSSSVTSAGTDAAAEMQFTKSRTPSQSSSRKSMDFHRLTVMNADNIKHMSIQRNSDVGSCGSSSVRWGRGSCDSIEENQLDRRSDCTEKSDLLKFAEALKTSHSRTGTVHKKSLSYSFG